MASSSPLPSYTLADLKDPTVAATTLLSDRSPGEEWTAVGMAPDGNTIWSKPNPLLISLLLCLSKIGISHITPNTLPDILYRSWILDDLGDPSYHLPASNGEGPLATRLSATDLLPFMGLIVNVDRLSAHEFEGNIRRRRVRTVMEHIANAARSQPK